MLKDTHWRTWTPPSLEAEQRRAVDAAIERLIAAATGTAGNINDARFDLRQSVRRLTETIRRHG